MRVLILGGGAREHALAWKISQSPLLGELFCAPGNPGTGRVCQNLPLNPEDPESVVEACRQRQVGLVVVGPEAPLVKGVADALAQAGIPVFGPSSRAAAIEGSKAFAKDVMLAAGIPTAHHQVFDDVEAAVRHVRSAGPVVIKADGLAAGKGVIVPASTEEAVAAVREVAKLGAASRRLVVEERLEGPEVSLIALCDGTRFLALPLAQDHKRVGEGDTGPNTGGMGAYAPAPYLAGPALEQLAGRAVGGALAELQRRGIPFRGALFAGLMLTPAGPRVLEYNCRFGDPETQPLMLQLDEDLLPLLEACARGDLKSTRLKVRSGAAVGVVLASERYPAAPVLGDAIAGLDADFGPDVQLFHAGTALAQGKVVTSGGRVLTVCARGASLDQARQRAYAAAAQVTFRGMHFRRDIGARALPEQRG